MLYESSEKDKISEEHTFELSIAEKPGLCNNRREPVFGEQPQVFVAKQDGYFFFPMRILPLKQKEVFLWQWILKPVKPRII